MPQEREGKVGDKFKSSESRKKEVVEIYLAAVVLRVEETRARSAFCSAHKFRHWACTADTLLTIKRCYNFLEKC